MQRTRITYHSRIISDQAGEPAFLTQNSSFRPVSFAFVRTLIHTFAKAHIGVQGPYPENSALPQKFAKFAKFAGVSRSHTYLQKR